MRNLAALALLWIAAPAAAQVALDGSLGPAGAILPVGGEYAITDDLGEYAGENLFHSFSTFDVNPGETATFSANLGLPTRVIARVTGGNGTSIAGTLRSTIPGASLFLLDPKGVDIFGEGAQLDVDGSFYASTADELRFESGEVLVVADATPDPLLSSAAPAAFGFTSESPSPMFIGGFDNLLSVPAGATLSFIGGEEVIVFGDPTPGYARFVINAPGANLEIAAAAGPIEIPVSLEDFDVTEVEPTALGTVNVSAATILMSSSGDTPAGSVLIRGGRFVLENSAQILAEHEVDGVDATGPIDIAVAGELLLGAPEAGFFDPTLIRTSSAGDGRGGDVILSGNAVTFEDGATVELLQGTQDDGTSTHAADGPDLYVSGGIVQLDTGALLSSLGSSTAGKSSSISLTATEEVSLSAGATIASHLLSGHAAEQGVISIDSPVLTVGETARIVSLNQGAGEGTLIDLDTGSVSVQGVIASGTESPADPGGPIEIEADHVLVSNPFGGESDGFIVAQNGGSITVDADLVELRDGGQIGTRTFIDTPAGDLRIEGADTVLASGVDAQDRPAGLFTRTRSSSGPNGTGGLLSIETRILEVLDGAELSSTTFGSANAGPIEIDASERVSVRGGPNGVSLISASAGPSSTGNGSTLSIETDWLELRDGGRIRTSTESEGNGGVIDARARVIEVSGVDPLTGSNASGFFSQSNTAGVSQGGDGGSISITATERVLLSNGGLVSALSTGTGTDAGLAGNVFIDAGQLFQMEDARVSTEALASTGGNVKVTAGSLVYLNRSSIQTDVLGGAGGGGDVTIDPVHTVLNHSSITARAVEGDGGNLLIQTDHYFQSGDSFLDASSQLGIDGTIQVTAPDTDLTGGLARLPSSYLDASALLERDCAARTERAGSFAVRVQTLPPAPDSALTPLDAGYCPLSEESP